MPGFRVQDAGSAIRPDRAGILGEHDTALRVKALESLLVEKGLVDPAALDALIDTYESKVGPQNGAAVVARAWSDPDYKARLMADATSQQASSGLPASMSGMRH